MPIEHPSLETVGKWAAILGPVLGVLGALWLLLAKLHRVVGDKAYEPELKLIASIPRLDQRVTDVEADMSRTAEILAQMPALTTAIERMRAELAEARRESREIGEKVGDQVADVRERLGEVRGEVRGNHPRRDSR